MSPIPAEPVAPRPDPDDPRTSLTHRVKEALLALPGYFNSTTNIEGIDGGGNFGRIARIGIMNDWTHDVLQRRLSGIPASEWISFLKRQTS